MRPSFWKIRHGLTVLALLACQQSVFALLNIDGTRNQIFVFGNASIAYDSNIFASSSQQGDYMVTASVGAELKRRAGIIAVNARATFDYQQFTEFTDLNSWNPSFFLELNKTTGRTTGSFTVNAFRSSRADSAVNLRTESWNFPIGLNVKYPINDRFYVTSGTGYLQRSYADTSSGLLTYTDISESVDIFYVYTSKLDLFGGYRIRIGQTDLGTTTDHALTVGVANGILPKVNGTVRVGYQWRSIDASGESYSQLTSSVGLTWNATRKFNVGISISRDFTTTAVGGSVDTLSAAVKGNYQLTRRFGFDSSVGYGRNRFLSGDPRTDTFFTWDAGASFHWNEHFQINGGYNYMKNWSTLPFSDFERSGYSLNVSSRF